MKEFDWEDFLNNARWFLYHRPDSMGAGYVYNFLTTRDSKFVLMNGMRSSYTTRQMVIRSRALLDEMQAVVQDGSSIEAPGRKKDDRVVAAALANYAWTEWVRPMMIANNMTYDVITARERGEESIMAGAVSRCVANYFRRAEELANEDPRDKLPKILLDRGLA
jgi:hypothetical protein